jgi:hypothetical protein
MIRVSSVDEVGALLGKSLYTLWYSLEQGYSPIRFEVERVLFGRPKGLNGEIGEVGIYLQAKNSEWLRRIPIEHVFETREEAEEARKRWEKKLPGGKSPEKSKV